MSSESPPRPIPIRISNQNAYVWSVDDVAILRSKHHICGILTGTLPQVSQQNVFLGLPLELMPEEVVLLVEKELAVLVDDSRSHNEPDLPDLQRWDSERQAHIKRQAALAEIKDAAESGKHGRAMTEDAIQKRREREERKKAELLKANPVSGMPASESQAKELAMPAPSSRQEEYTHPYTVVVPTQSSFDWYKPDGHTYSTITSARAAGIWNYPATLYDRARCGVFRGLWDQGYYMGSGIKFGGDYLVYPGDSLRYHSHFVASVIDSPATAIRAMEIVAHGRLGTATKKAHLLCGWDDDKQEVSYFSIEWAGFG